MKRDRTPRQDNATLDLKVTLRQRALAELEGATPVLLETHGGFGYLYSRCYLHVIDGIVIESNPTKAAYLARQRPSWSVYEADSAIALDKGYGAHLSVNFVDCDPYGQPWPILDAFWTSERPRVDRLVVVVTDGLRQYVRSRGAGATESLRGMAERFGNNLYKQYLDIAKLMMVEKGAAAGYRMVRWTGYYCGNKHDMTHYAAVYDRDAK